MLSPPVRSLTREAWFHVFDTNGDGVLDGVEQREMRENIRQFLGEERENGGDDEGGDDGGDGGELEEDSFGTWLEEEELGVRFIEAMRVLANGKLGIRAKAEEEHALVEGMMEEAAA